MILGSMIRALIDVCLTIVRFVTIATSRVTVATTRMTIVTNKHSMSILKYYDGDYV